MQLPTEISRTIATQHGLVTARQLRAHGITRAQQGRLVAHGVLESLHRGVYRALGAHATWEQRLLAAVLAGPSRAVASHQSAARLWSLSGWRRGRPTVLVPRGSSARIDGARVHHSVVLAPADREVIDGIPVTSLARTLVDLSACSPPDRLARALSEATDRRDVTLTELRQCVGRLESAPGRRPRVIYELMREFEARGLLTESALEDQVLRILKERSLPRPVSQHWVPVAGGQYRLDFAYPDHRIGIEADGFDAHRGRDSFHADRARRNELTAAGWTLFHFTATTTPRHIAATLGAVLTRDRLPAPSG